MQEILILKNKIIQRKKIKVLVLHNTNNIKQNNKTKKVNLVKVYSNKYIQLQKMMYSKKL